VAIYAKENAETKKRNAALAEKRTRRGEKTDKIEISEKSDMTDKDAMELRCARSS
jgi:hypothetical protein